MTKPLDLVKWPVSLGRVMRTSVMTASVLAFAAMAAPVSAQTIIASKHSALRVLDPILTTAYMSRNHGYMIYDTLFALDEDVTPQPQMVDTWEVSDDGLTYTFTLRDGLMFHDGAPVTGEDVAASIARWGERDSMGQVLMEYVDTMSGSSDDPNLFIIQLKEPYGLVIDSLAKPSSNVPFIMPKRLAETPSTEPVPEQIGSGPFKWVADEFQPGVKAVYEKFEDYVPRDEPASWAAGGKVVKVDRVEWVVFPDDQTTLNAIQSGELDYWEQPPIDLLPILEANPDVTVRNTNTLGYQTIIRPNALNAPMDDPLIRKAAIASIYQKNVLDALIGNPEYYELCGAMFVCGTPLATDVGSETLTEGNGQDLARELLEEAGYDGTPIVLMHPTDVGTLRTQPVVVAQAMRDVGFEVDLQAMDWQTLVGRRASQAPVDEGGWHMFATNWVGADVFNPLVNNMVNGKGPDGGWFGWPEVPEIEELRTAYATAETLEEQKEIAAQIQELAYDEGMYAPIGQYFVPSAWTSNLEGVLDGPAPYFWNISKN
ncbi:ABC transporter substrate-binding protein [Lutimaribacter sp. EGI FJ00015]|uniref:ABC transporter substrate-binding protein n=1 Tax=Lutimaribacter degradans TaxID=2945989 RepID=A0ACC5ZT44_9RHOB|nr:ABC transporter substrate-binding protein [Lutimaribacter sp. EGI FJ00013]MCM2561315.1 ABC transporter substrate-binding protein [Lutimaribacter sp. EGI FJ00013]MCO0611734.1 ABC transporter substrate-binding protein [Lutimaribacter sp. EGI FJ00015]MCO0635144.1 ABC transporter substrate-binding protein [Lutimaribacter sp. EGI FJ00014]